MNSLLSLSYCAIKNTAHRTLAADITLSKMMKITNESLNILNSQTIKKEIVIHVSDRMGCDITLILYKKNSTIQLSFHKKHSFLCCIQIINSDSFLLDIITYKDKCLYKLLVEIILFEFPNTCKQYIANGMRKKRNIIKLLLRTLIHHQNIYVLCEYNDKIMLDI